MKIKIPKVIVNFWDLLFFNSPGISEFSLKKPNAVSDQPDTGNKKNPNRNHVFNFTGAVFRKQSRTDFF